MSTRLFVVPYRNTIGADAGKIPMQRSVTMISPAQSLY